MSFRMFMALTAATIPVAIGVAPVSADAATPARVQAARVQAAQVQAARVQATRVQATRVQATRVQPALSVTLTVADNGRQIRVRRGDRILVRLAVNPRRDADPTTWWRAIDESGDALRARPQTAIAIRGLTRGRYQAVARGEATLTSSRAVCPQLTGGPTCHALQGWSVTVDVR